MDCDDARDDVHPGAPVVCGDGVINGCSGPAEDVARGLGVEEIGVLPPATLHLAPPGVLLDIPTVVTLPPTDSPNAAVAVRAVDESGSSVAWILPFDHASPAPLLAPVTITALDRELLRGSISAVGVAASTLTSATLVVQGTVEDGSAGYVDLPFFGSFEAGRASAQVSPVDPDRTSCPFSEIIRGAWSARGNWYVFVGVNVDRTVYSLHAVDATGSIDCVADVGAAGFPLSQNMSIVAAGDIVLGQNHSGVAPAAFVWKPGGRFGPQALPVPFIGDDSLVATSDHEYLLTSQVPARPDLVTLRNLDCNRSEGCVELSARELATRPSFRRRLLRWGAATAVLTQFSADGSSAGLGIELRFASAAGAPLGEGFAIVPWASDGTTASVEFFGATVVPRSAPALPTEMLIALVVRYSDDAMGVELARVRGCTAR